MTRTSSTVNELRLEPYPAGDELQWLPGTLLARIMIDGAPFRQLVLDHMRAVDAPPQNLAGDFDDLPLDMLAFPSRHLLGEPEDAVPRDEEGLPPWTALQTCICANFGCGGIGAVITVDDRTVVCPTSAMRRGCAATAGRTRRRTACSAAPRGGPWGPCTLTAGSTRRRSRPPSPIRPCSTDRPAGPSHEAAPRAAAPGTAEGADHHRRELRRPPALGPGSRLRGGRVRALLDTDVFLWRGARRLLARADPRRRRDDPAGGLNHHPSAIAGYVFDRQVFSDPPSDGRVAGGPCGGVTGRARAGGSAPPGPLPRPRDATTRGRCAPATSAGPTRRTRRSAPRPPRSRPAGAAAVPDR